MRTRDFIVKTIGKKRDRERWCSSVMVDCDGVVYSYGRHYPLAVIIDDPGSSQEIGFVNTSGYSVTTAKHIGWAFSALAELGVKARGVELERRCSFDFADIYFSADRQARRVAWAMAAKKRHNTWVYKNLKYRLHEAIKTAEVAKSLERRL